MIEKGVKLLIKLYFRFSIRIRYPRLASLGTHCRVETPVTITAPENVRLGDNVVIKKWVLIYGLKRTEGAFIAIGDHVEINPFCIIIGGDRIDIGERALISPHVTIMSSGNDYRGGEIIAQNPFKIAPVNIGSNVHIGTGAVILPGVTIGEGAVIGAGAVVTKDIPPRAVALGVPAKVVKYRPEPGS